MLKLIRNNQKKVMAVVAVLSMIAFVASTGSGRGGRSLGNGEDERAVGSVAGGKDLRVADLTSAKNELAAAAQYLRITAPDQSGEPQPLDAVAFLLDANSRDVADRIREKPETFALLRREAEDAGVRPSDNDVQGVMATPAYAGPSPDDNPDAYALTRRAVTDLLAVRLNHDRMAEAVKVSRPAVDNATVRGTAAGGEQVSMNVVHLAAADYLPKVPAPTTRQVRAQFDKYKDTLAGGPTPENPFGFGYKYPVKLTVQYVRLTPAAAERAVVATRTEYDWDVAARKYYLTHPDEFRIPSAAAATTAPTTAPAAGPVKPFDGVRPQALAAVRDPLVAALTTQVRNYLVATTTADWQASRTAAATPYADDDYFKHLADDVRGRFQQVAVDGVDAGPLSLDQIRTLPDLTGTATGELQSAATLLGTQAAAFLGQKNPSDLAALATLRQPTPGLTTPDPTAAAYRRLGMTPPLTGSMAVARATAVTPSRPPPDVEAVRPAVEADWRTAAGYDLAKADADRLLTAAKAGDLSNAARELNRTVVATPPVSYNNTADLPPLPREVAAAFVAKAFDALLSGYAPAAAGPKPAALIALPESARLSVAQLLYVTPTWMPQTLHTDLMRSAIDLRRRAVSRLTAAWYDPTAVATRMGYSPVKGQAE